MLLKTNKKSRGSVRSLLLSAVLIAVCALLLGCAGEPIPCRETLDGLLGDAPRPAGVTYLCGAEVGSEAYLSPETARALYGETAEELLSLCEDFAIFLSEGAYPFEAAVFRCYSASDCEKLATALLARIDDIRIALRDTELSGAYENAEVTLRGRVVTMRGGVQNISR